VAAKNSRRSGGGGFSSLFRSPYPVFRGAGSRSGSGDFLVPFPSMNIVNVYRPSVRLFTELFTDTAETWDLPYIVRKSVNSFSQIP
jgi:hypothetical protein